MKDLTIIIPAKDEKESLPTVIKNLKSLKCEIIITMKNDDIETVKAINNENVKIFYQSGKGYGNSLREAIESCDPNIFVFLMLMDLLIIMICQKCIMKLKIMISSIQQDMKVQEEVMTIQS